MAVARNLFALVAGVAIGALAGFLALVWVLSQGDDLGTLFGAMVVWIVVTVEVTAGAVGALVLVANERRPAGLAVAAGLVLVLAAEYAWLVS